MVRGDQVPFQHQLLPQNCLTTLGRRTQIHGRAFDPFEEGIVRSLTLNNTLFQNVTSFKAFYTLGRSTGYKELKAAPTIDRGYDYNNRFKFFLQSLWDAVSRGKLSESCEGL